MFVAASIPQDYPLQYTDFSLYPSLHFLRDNGVMYLQSVSVLNKNTLPFHSTCIFQNHCICIPYIKKAAYPYQACLPQNIPERQLLACSILIDSPLMILFIWGLHLLSYFYQKSYKRTCEINYILGF